jgi:hypothetical protein
MEMSVLRSLTRSILRGRSKKCRGNSLSELESKGTLTEWSLTLKTRSLRR